jgi:hypothetical protein
MGRMVKALINQVFDISDWRNGTISKKIIVEATIQGKINSKVFTPKLPLALDEGSTSPLSQWSGQAYCAKT